MLCMISPVSYTHLMELFSQYAVAAAKEAMADAGIEMGKEDPFRVGVIVGSGIGSLQAMESADQRLIQRGPCLLYTSEYI